MDEVTKVMDELFTSIKRMDIAELTKRSITEQVDVEQQAFYNQLEDTVPEKTGGLKRALRAKRISDKNWYGYMTEFAGRNKKGQPYEKIANILNYGSSHIRPRRFITRAVSLLKGMDDRINERFTRKIDAAYEKEVRK